MAISLCSPPNTKGQKSSSSSNAKSYKHIEKAGPSEATIIDARRLLEKVGKLASFSIIFDAILPNLKDFEKMDNVDRAGRNKRSRLSLERDSDEDNGTDSFAIDSRVSSIKQYSQKVLDCKQVWQILALGDMMESTEGKKRHRGVGKLGRVDQEGREGEETLRFTSQYERDAVWRVLEILLQAWTSNSDEKQDDDSSHLAVQYREAPHRFQATKGGSQITPSTNVGEAFDLIFAGIAPNFSPQFNQTGESAKSKLNERVRRRETALSLLVEVSTRFWSRFAQ